MQFRHLKNFVYSVCHKEYLSSSCFILTANSLKYIKTAQKQNSVEENMKVILSTIIPIYIKKFEK